MRRRIEIGYLCSKGHFQFNDDPDGDSCRTKIIGKVYVKPIRGAYTDMFVEAMSEAMTSLHHKIAVWRREDG